jgi:hypothetical protein
MQEFVWDMDSLLHLNFEEGIPSSNCRNVRTCHCCAWHPFFQLYECKDLPIVVLYISSSLLHARPWCYFVQICMQRLAQQILTCWQHSCSEHAWVCWRQRPLSTGSSCALNMHLAYAQTKTCGGGIVCEIVAMDTAGGAVCRYTGSSWVDAYIPGFSAWHFPCVGLACMLWMKVPVHTRWTCWKEKSTLVWPLPC